MSFATSLALLIAALVVAPVLAHLLRRRRTVVRDFPPALLVQAAQPVARHRARLEDRALFSVRALVMLALAVLGATPFLSCSRLSVGRKGGGSVALVLVVDDSLSMRAKLGSGTRFSRAIQGANEVLGSLREGDAVAIVAAGAPPRVLLAPTTELELAHKTLAALAPTDRGTDLDGALSLGATLGRSLAQVDRRLVLLSDLSDGRSSPEPVGSGLDVPLWAPLPELRSRLADCAVLRAQRKGAAIRVAVACGADADADGRRVEAIAAGQVVASSPLLARARLQEVEITLPAGAQSPAMARLTGADAVVEDDQAPVVDAARVMQIGVVSDLAESGPVTGGPSPVEQALAALDETVAVRPLPEVPDDPEALNAYAALVLDDPPGLTPEARAAIRAWGERGGVGLLLLGPRAGGAILGAAFDPFLPGPVRWSTEAPAGADPKGGELGEASGSLGKLGARGRALLESRAADQTSPLARWSDGAPLVFQRALGRGVLTVATLPGSAEVSDFPLRPAFLEVLSRVVEAGRARQVGKRSVVGEPWVFLAGAPVGLAGPTGPVPRWDTRDRAARGFSSEQAGLYSLSFADQSRELRVVEVDEREVDLTPRPVAEAASAAELGSQKARIDASPYVALVLLLAVMAEAALRLRAGVGGEAPAAPKAG
jgi:hypothetical protein